MQGEPVTEAPDGDVDAGSGDHGKRREDRQNHPDTHGNPPQWSAARLVWLGASDAA
ncbi:hypothetical protein Raf01_81610 [Rugosimonospora africana]|uniref:Uncharacterized protein n=1 Tax=Rugosimonospora africana TaxID=556532 RepID=A0A8J3VVJ3_9ACTN|nr:hypothetical protein Raf01_81610 [Rugosimonospora africana]